MIVLNIQIPIICFIYVLASENTCVNHFPLKESASIIKKIINQYGVPVIRKDGNGTEWMNKLIVNNDNFKVDGVQYYLNDNRLPPENTFYFDSLQFYPNPIFVVTYDQLKNWRPDVPNKTFALTNIGLICSEGRKACGLKCCVDETDRVQKGFLDLSLESYNGTARTIQESAFYRYGEITYFLKSFNGTEHEKNNKCSYVLSFHDPLYRRATINGKQILAIYFTCQSGFSCCGLACLSQAETLKLEKRMEKSVFGFDWKSNYQNTLLIIGSILALIVFTVVILYNYRKISSTKKLFKEVDHNGRVVLKSIQTQTSILFLNKDVELKVSLL